MARTDLHCDPMARSDSRARMRRNGGYALRCLSRKREKPTQTNDPRRGDNSLADLSQASHATCRIDPVPTATRNKTERPKLHRARGALYGNAEGCREGGIVAVPTGPCPCHTGTFSVLLKASASIRLIIDFNCFEGPTSKKS